MATLQECMGTATVFVAFIVKLVQAVNVSQKLGAITKTFIIAIQMDTLTWDKPVFTR